MTLIEIKRTSKIRIWTFLE